MKAARQADLFTQVCRTYRLPDPQAEYRFARDAGRDWRIDFYFEANGRKVALEVEGGVWTGGRHTRPQGFSGDMEKYNALACRGILLLRVTPDQLMFTATFDLIKSALYAPH